jgi:EmrB/QacA subfamily drug resistance transporter
MSRWVALTGLVLSGLVIEIDVFVLVTALPTLSARLGASTAQLQWLSDAYTLAVAGLLLPAGVLGDRVGRRRLLLAGLALFGLSSIAASQMTSVDGLIAMRAIMGVGAAIILPLSLSVLPSMFTEEERPRAVALTSVGAVLGLPLGPVLAGWLLTHFDWGAVFLINGPIALAALLGVALLVPEGRDEGAPRVDWAGAALVVASTTLLVYGIIEEPADGWADPRVVTAIAGGAVLLAGFVARELRTRAPLVDLRLFLNGRFTWATVAFAIVGFAMTGVMFILTPYLQVVQGNDAQGTGIRLLPMISGVILSAIASSRLVGRVGTRAMVAAGLAVTGAGLVVLSRAGGDDGYGPVAAGLVVIGLGLGLTMPASTDAILGALPSRQTGAGTGLSRTLQQVSASFGVAILGSMLNATYRGGLEARLTGLPGGIREAALAGVAGAGAAAAHLPAPLAGRLLGAARDAYAGAMGEVLLACAALTGVGAVLVALYLPRPATPELE